MVLIPSLGGGVVVMSAITAFITLCYKKKFKKKAIDSAITDSEIGAFNTINNGEPFYDTVKDSPENTSRKNTASIASQNNHSSVLHMVWREEANPRRMCSFNDGITTQLSMQDAVLENERINPYSSLSRNLELSVHTYQELAKERNQNGIDSTPHIYDECGKEGLYLPLQKDRRLTDHVYD